MEKEISVFRAEQIKLEVLEPFYVKLDNEEESICRKFTKTGEQRIKKDWANGHGEEMYNEDGSPVMEDVWDYVEKTHLSDEDKYRLAIIRSIRAKLDDIIRWGLDEREED